MKSCRLAWQFTEAARPLLLSKVKPPQIIEPDEIIVLNKVASINPVDWKFIDNNPLDWQAGYIPGVDGAGIVIKAGSQVPSDMLGKRVCYHQSLTKYGSFSSYTVLKFGRVMTLPDTFSLVKAAALPCPMLTAIQAMQKLPALNGRKLLIGGFGSVAKALMQISNNMGASVDLLSSHALIDEVSPLGVRRIFRDEKDILEKYFAVLDLRGQESATRLASVLGANGHLVCIQDRIEAPIFKAFSNAISYHEVALGALHHYGNDQDWSKLMLAGEQYIQKLHDLKYIAETPDTFAFEKLNEALIHSKQTRRKTVICAL